MKTKHLFFILFLIIDFKSFAQSGWTIQQSKTKEGLYSVFFSNTENGYAVGNRGTILKTNNGGVQWIADTVQDNGNFTSLFSIKNMTYVVGRGFLTTPKTHLGGGLIFKTKDMMANWSVTKTDYGEYLNYLYSIYFVNSDTGYIVGQCGLILKTIDGGENWIVKSLLRQDEEQYDLKSVYFINANTGYAVGGKNKGMILKTIDGGETWIKKSCKSNQTLNSTFFINSKIGYAVGGTPFGENGIILKTIDAGEGWIEQTYPKLDKEKYELESIFFNDSATGYAVGGSVIIDTVKNLMHVSKVDGLILKTNDGGKTWIRQNSGVDKVLLSVFFTDYNNGYIVGDGGVILKTMTGGK